MPDIKADGCTIHVEVAGPEQAPVLMLSNSLGTDLHMWDQQVAPFTRHFRLIRCDRRGHGRSDAPQGPYTMERLGRDVLAILDGLGIARTNWCGLSMGGMVGQWLGAHAPSRIDKLILSNTACYYPDKTIWDERMKFARANGIARVATATMERWFSQDFRANATATIARMTEMFAKTSLEGYLGCCAAIRDMDHRALLPRITARPWSSPAGSTWRRRRRSTNSLPTTSPERNCSPSRRGTSPTSSSRRLIPRQCWDFC